MIGVREYNSQNICLWPENGIPQASLSGTWRMMVTAWLMAAGHSWRAGAGGVIDGRDKVAT
jgi:hypothetical protein